MSSTPKDGSGDPETINAKRQVRRVFISGGQQPSSLSPSMDRGGPVGPLANLDEIESPQQGFERYEDSTDDEED